MRAKRRACVLHSERPHWVSIPEMDEEMKRRLDIKDRSQFIQEQQGGKA
jgi:hypothetical protein